MCTSCRNGSHAKHAAGVGVDEFAGGPVEEIGGRHVQRFGTLCCGCGSPLLRRSGRHGQARQGSSPHMPSQLSPLCVASVRRGGRRLEKEIESRSSTIGSVDRDAEQASAGAGAEGECTEDGEHKKMARTRASLWLCLVPRWRGGKPILSGSQTAGGCGHGTSASEEFVQPGSTKDQEDHEAALAKIQLICNAGIEWVTDPDTGDLISEIVRRVSGVRSPRLGHRCPDQSPTRCQRCKLVGSSPAQAQLFSWFFVEPGRTNSSLALVP